MFVPGPELETQPIGVAESIPLSRLKKRLSKAKCIFFLH